MCKMLVSTETSEKEFEFIIYNIVLSETSGRFAKESIYDKLRQHQIEVRENKVKQLLDSWIERGLLYDDVSDYVINTAWD